VIVSYYNVIRECVVGKLHYAKPTVQPIEVDDETAAPLVAEGALEPYGSRIDRQAAYGIANALAEGVDVDVADDAQIEESLVGEQPNLPEKPKPRRGGRSRSY